MIRRSLLVFSSWCLLCAVGFFVNPALAQTTTATNCTKPNILLVINKSSRMSATQWFGLLGSVGQLVASRNSGSRFGVIAFDTNARVLLNFRDNAQAAVTQLAPQLFNRSGRANHVRAMTAVQAYLTTSITRDNVKGRTHIVILVSNGTTDDGSPAARIRALRSLTVAGQRYDIKTYVMGQNSSNNTRNLTSWASVGGTSRFYTARQQGTLSTQLAASEPKPRAETCNNADDDCDGRIDESLIRSCTSGNCGSGTQTCRAGRWGTCSAQPRPEVCNGRDDDCDGKTDEDLPLRTCQTACGTGRVTCINGRVGCSAPLPSRETCDGKDNDCDGEIDEGCPCRPGQTRACGTDTGECKKGTQTCVNGRWSATCTGGTNPIVEQCNGKDDDCDGLTDETLRRACNNACGAGTETCSAGKWAGCTAPTPRRETCNGRDDDCDGQIDEGCPCRQGQVRRCGTDTGRCRRGFQVCLNGRWPATCPGSVQPTTESCNGQDDDCDGLTDEGLTRACNNRCGRGTQTCQRGRWVGCTAPTPQAEICDGKDNDCDGQTDEGCQCKNGETRACGSDTGECKKGTQACVNGQWSATCNNATTPTRETCDGKDNDCDGQTDESLRRACRNGCGFGTETCSGGQWRNCSAPTPRRETCNGRDDDCDGQVDEGCPCRPGQSRFCGTNTGACRAGRQFCVNFRWETQCRGSIGPATEACDGADNDCDGRVDEDLRRACSTACGTGQETCQRGRWAGCTAPTVQNETCDGKDNDCDGTIDEGCACKDGETRDCGKDTGACSKGKQTCVKGQWSATCVGEVGAKPEFCDGKDNDCDGQIDESLTRACANACGAGNETCNAGKWEKCSAPTPTRETCNARDDDCDGQTDEGCPCFFGQTRQCGSNTGECRPGRQRCVCPNGVPRCLRGVWDGACSGQTGPKTETCDGKDNDCDGLVDEALSRACKTACGSGTETCKAGKWADCSATQPQTESCDGKDNDCDGQIDETLTRPCKNACGAGNETCNAGKWEKCSAPKPTTETCDGKDNDCDGQTDEGCQCRNGDTRACGVNVGACKQGRQTCINGRWAAACVGEVKPSTETCDGKDNDCDGQTDETLTRPCKNGCGSGTETCNAGKWEKCSAPTPGTETCDGKDNDCDGQTDEGLSRSCSNACGAGTETCNAGKWVGCTAPNPVQETCNGRDDDCDGQVDEGCPCRAGQTRPCGTNVGECKAGSQRCVNGQWEPTCTGQTGPQAEVCDGKDNDCDGQSDETLSRACKNACGTGTETCNAGKWEKCSAPTPGAETCDNKDNDCDGRVDEDLRRDCSNACGAGTELCSGGQWVSCTAPKSNPETCDGKDNDCDGTIDEGCACRTGQTRTCGNTKGECKAGTQRCIANKWDEKCDGAVGPQTEVCDGKDNNCDGQIDETLVRACKNACGDGVEACVSGTWQNCTAPKGTTEVCDGKDNDCDGQVDETLSRTCSNRCGSGNEVCQSGNWVNCTAPSPAPEVCDGKDNNCDGQTDEGCVCVPGTTRPCGSGTGECKQGSQKCVATADGRGQWSTVCENQVGPQAETCDGKDNDCDGAVDEALIRACRNACGSGVEACVQGTWARCTAPTPTPEVCDGKDNNCDGQTDEGCVCKPGETRPCGGNNGVGQCQAGTQTCVAGKWAAACVGEVKPSAETCDGADNDCDGQIDEELSRACSSACGAGSESCSSGQWTGCTAPQPEVEVCDGKDNNCDGQIDEGENICGPGQLCLRGQCLAVEVPDGGQEEVAGDAGEPISEDNGDQDVCFNDADCPTPQVCRQNRCVTPESSENSSDGGSENIAESGESGNDSIAGEQTQDETGERKVPKLAGGCACDASGSSNTTMWCFLALMLVMLTSLRRRRS